jgi:aspartate aminotransferase
MFQLLARVQELQRAGKDIIRFEIGDSTLVVHQHIIDATKKALDDGHIRYTNSQGILELRQAICDYTETSLGFRPDPEQVMIMPANGVIDSVIRCTVNPGEEVIVPDPGFVTYQAVFNYTGVKGIPLRQHEENGRFRIHPEELRDIMTPSTRLIIHNSPNNPTGMAMDSADIEQIYRIAEEKDVYLLSDEIYSRLVYDKSHYSPGVYDQCRERTIILNGFSKGYCMSGWRLGYAIGPVPVIKKMALLLETIYSCIPPFIQYAGISALTEHQEKIEGYRDLVKESRDLIVQELNALPGVSCPLPEGAIYAFPNITDTGLTSQQFADRMLENAGVALLPGPNFGPAGEGYVRLCYARTPDTIREGCARMRRSLEAL